MFRNQSKLTDLTGVRRNARVFSALPAEKADCPEVPQEVLPLTIE